MFKYKKIKHLIIKEQKIKKMKDSLIIIICDNQESNLEPAG